MAEKNRKTIERYNWREKIKTREEMMRYLNTAERYWDSDTSSGNKRETSA